MTVEQLIKILSLAFVPGETAPEPLAVVSIYDGETDDYIQKSVLIDRDNRPGKNKTWWNDCRKKKIESIYLGLDFEGRATLTINI